MAALHATASLHSLYVVLHWHPCIGHFSRPCVIVGGGIAIMTMRHLGVFALWISAMFAQVSNSKSPFVMMTPSPALESDTLDFRRVVPDFEARDLNNRSWRNADLRGKLTVVQIWATWCLACRQEHPALQDFYNRAPSMRNVQVLTFSVDRDPEQVQSYMQEKGYTFPVIVDEDLGLRLFPREGGVPKTWVIGAESRRTDPFTSWTFGRILIEVEKLAKGNSERPK
jgi:peroxiredoxin